MGKDNTLTNEELENLYLNDIQKILWYHSHGMLSDNELEYVIVNKEKALVEANRPSVVWHPYPKEKPKSDRYKFYNVTLSCAWGSIVSCSKYIDGKFSPLHIGYGDEYVSAWAELPKPYEG